MDGALIAGDAGGFLNSMRLKGIHLAMRTGMLAAETAFEAVRAGDTSAAALSAYSDRIDASPVKRRAVSRFATSTRHSATACLPGLAFAGLAIADERAAARTICTGHAGHERMKTLAWYYGIAQDGALSRATRPPIDRKLTFDKVTNVHYSGTAHDEDQPVAPAGAHRGLQHDLRTRVRPSVHRGSVPANVYEIAHDADGAPRLQINASNCVHCKTCDIMDPYQVITWVPPEGGGGPQYNGM